MGGSESKLMTGVPISPYQIPSENETQSEQRRESTSMMSKFMNFGFGTGGGSSSQGTNDKSSIAQGTQALSDLNWKKKENKYLGPQSISIREQEEVKEMEKRPQIEQYLTKFPDNEKFLGFENVSYLLKTSYVYRPRTFAMPIRPPRSCTTASLSENRFLIGSRATLTNTIC